MPLLVASLTNSHVTRRVSSLDTGRTASLPDDTWQRPAMALRPTPPSPWPRSVAPTGIPSTPICAERGTRARMPRISPRRSSRRSWARACWRWPTASVASSARSCSRPSTIFVANQQREARAHKRGGEHTTTSLDDVDFVDAERRYARELAHTNTPERLFERRWALTVLEQAFAKSGQEYTSSGKAALFAELKPFLGGGPDDVSYGVIASRLDMTEGAVKVAVRRQSGRAPSSPPLPRHPPV